MIPEKLKVTVRLFKIIHQENIFTQFLRNRPIMVTLKTFRLNQQFHVALLQSLKYRDLGAKSIRSLEKVQILTLKMTIF